MTLTREVITGEGVPSAIGPYSPAVSAGGFLVLADTEVGERTLSVDIRLEVDDEAIAPSHHLGIRHRDLGTALPPTSVDHIERQRLLTEIEVHLGLDPNLLTPGLLKVPMPDPHPIVPAIHGVANRSKQRIPLNPPVAQRDKALDVPR